MHALADYILNDYSPRTVAVDINWRPKIKAILMLVSNPQQFELTGERPHYDNAFAELEGSQCFYIWQ